jgi:hypothetical protein
MIRLSASKVLLILQATLSVVLVAGATMLSRSLNNLEHQDFGFQLQGRDGQARHLLQSLLGPRHRHQSADQPLRERQ